MIREREKAHAAAFEQLIYLFGIAITFAAKKASKRGCAGSGEVRVNMHVASHECNLQRCALMPDDTRAKVLKIQVLNSLDTRNTLLIFL